MEKSTKISEIQAFILTIRDYWTVYGGWDALISSAYLKMAAIITALCFPLWSQPEWWADVLSISPSLLGLSLGAFAIMLAFATEDFRELSAGEAGDGHSPWMEMNAAFVHFIVIQFIGVIVALIAKGRPFSSFGITFQSQVVVTTIFWGFGFFIFAYGLTLVLAATFSVFDLSRAFDAHVSAKRRKVMLTREEKP